MDPKKEICYFGVPGSQSIGSEMTTNFKTARIVILCFVIDIGTILENIHSCFLIDIGLISKISSISLNDYSGFVGARLFPN